MLNWIDLNRDFVALIAGIIIFILAICTAISIIKATGEKTQTKKKSWKYRKPFIDTLKLLGMLLSYSLLGWFLAWLMPEKKFAIQALILIPTLPTLLIGSYIIYKEWANDKN